MKKSFNFTHLGIILLGYFVVNIFLNFFRRFLPKRAEPIQPEPVITFEKENKIGFVKEEPQPEPEENEKEIEPENP